MPIDRLSLAEIDRRNQAELPLVTKSEPLRRNVFTPLARALLQQQILISSMF